MGLKDYLKKKNYIKIIMETLINEKTNINKTKFVEEIEAVKKKHSNKLKEDEMNLLLKDVTSKKQNEKINNKKNEIILKTINYKNKKYFKDSLDYLWCPEKCIRIGLFKDNMVYKFNEKFIMKPIVLKKLI